MTDRVSESELEAIESGRIGNPTERVLVAEIRSLRKERDAARFSPLGDNHHNAAACPYCNPKWQELQKKFRQMEDDLKDTRLSHYKLCHGLRNVLGYHTWPEIKGLFVDGVISLVKARLAVVQAEKKLVEP